MANTQSNPNPTNGPEQRQHTPIWQPWGAGGCLWRSLVYLLGFLLLCLLFALLLRGCDNMMNNPLNGGDDIPSPDQLPDDPYKDISEELRDTSFVEEWIDSIPGVDELPDPEDNFIPIVDSTSIITNPEDSLTQIVGDQLVVLFNSQDLKQDMADFARRFKQVYPGSQYRILYYNPASGIMLLGVPQSELLKVARELPSKIPGINFYVDTNDVFTETDVPSDPGFGNPKYDEYFKLIQAYEAWDITRGNPNVKVAIVDSYFDLTNPEIGQRFVDRIYIPNKTRNVLPPPMLPTPQNIDAYCHGSHVAGIAIGGQNNQIGCSGIAPQCTWIPIALGQELYTINIIEGILYAVYHGADVVNFSIGRNFSNIKDIDKIPLNQQVAISTQTDKRGEAFWSKVIQIANDHNCVLCTSSGNENILMGMDPKNRPDGIIKVEAVDGKGQKAKFSNFGRIPEANLDYSTVSAPGVKLWSVSPKHCAPLNKLISDALVRQYGPEEGYAVSYKEGLQEMSGTSMASPVVAGAVALLKSKNKDLTTEEVIHILVKTAKQTDKVHRIGPTIQLRDALNEVGGEKLNYDDLMKDHNLLVGKWKSTKTLYIGEKEEIWTYFIFTSPTSGRVEHHCLRDDRVYTTNLSVKWTNNSISIVQAGGAVSQYGQTLAVDRYKCRPNKNRLLETVCSKPNGEGEDYTFLLEKVK